MTNVVAELIEGPLPRGLRGDPGLIPFGDYIAGETYPATALVRHGGEIQWRALRKTDAEPSDASADWVRFVDATPAEAARDAAIAARDAAIAAAGGASSALEELQNFTDSAWAAASASSASAVSAAQAAVQAAVARGPRDLTTTDLVALLGFANEVEPIVAGGDYVVGGLELAKPKYVLVDGVTFLLGGMPREKTLVIVQRATAGSFCKARIDEGMTFINVDTSSTEVTIGAGRIAIIRRSSPDYFTAEIVSIPDSVKTYDAGPAKKLFRMDSGTWMMIDSRAVAAGATTSSIALPTGFAGLNAAMIMCSFSSLDTNTGAPVPSCQVMSDTTYQIKNPATSAQAGATPVITTLFFGLTRSSGPAAVTFANVATPVRTRSLHIDGQSHVTTAMMGQGRRAFFDRMGELALATDTFWTHGGQGGSGLMAGTAANTWWDHVAGAPGPAMVTALAAWNAKPGAQPERIARLWMQGDSDADNVGKPGFEYVTAAGYAAALQASHAYFVSQSGQATLPMLVCGEGPRATASSIDRGLTTIRQALVDACDGVNIIQGPDIYDLADYLRDGAHFHYTGQQIIFRRWADFVGNLFYGKSVPVGPTRTGFARVSAKDYEVTLAASYGSIIWPANPKGFALLPDSNPYSQPVAIAIAVPISATKMRISTIDTLGPNPWFCVAWGGLAGIARSDFIFDASGYPLRVAPLVQATG